MKTKHEILSDKRFSALSFRAWNIKLYRKGIHHAEFFSSLGRGFAETKTKINKLKNERDIEIIEAGM